MNQRELEKYLWGAATTLRGAIDAGDYKQFIFPLLFFKRICDVYDEEFEIALAKSDGKTTEYWKKESPLKWLRDSSNISSSKDYFSNLI